MSRMYNDYSTMEALVLSQATNRHNLSHILFIEYYNDELERFIKAMINTMKSKDKKMANAFSCEFYDIKTKMLLDERAKDERY